jgi:hypothetical protein
MTGVWLAVAGMPALTLSAPPAAAASKLPALAGRGLATAGASRGHAIAPVSRAVTPSLSRSPSVRSPILTHRVANIVNSGAPALTRPRLSPAVHGLPATLGGAASYDAKRGAIIGGQVSARRPK